MSFSFLRYYQEKNLTQKMMGELYLKLYGSVKELSFSGESFWRETTGAHGLPGEVSARYARRPEKEAVVPLRVIARPAYL